MKIGIVTLWDGIDNYGGILQTYALQHYLQELGHDAYIIRYGHRPNAIQKTFSNIKKYIKIFHHSFPKINPYFKSIF